MIVYRYTHTFTLQLCCLTNSEWRLYSANVEVSQWGFPSDAGCMFAINLIIIAIPVKYNVTESTT